MREPTMRNARILFVTLLATSCPVLLSAQESGGKAATPQAKAALDASFSLGIVYGGAAVSKAVEPGNSFGNKISWQACESAARKLGVRLEPLPELKKQSTPAKAHLQMVELHFAGPMQKVAKNIEEKHGKECARIFLWAAVISVVTPPLPHPCLPARLAGELAERYTVKAGLPKELALPLLKATQSDNLRITATRCGTRTKFYIDHVLSGKENLSLLTDASFDTNQEAALAAQVARQKDARFDKKWQEWKGPAERTTLLLRELDSREGKDPTDKIGGRLRELGAGAIPTLCRLLAYYRGRQLVVDAKTQAALDVVIFRRTFAEVQGGVTAETAKGWEGGLTTDLARCCATEESRLGASVAISRLSLVTEGNPIPLLIAAREGATKTRLAGVDLALEAAASAHITRGITRITGYLTKHPDKNVVPGSEWQADAEAARQVGKAVPSVLAALAKEFGPRSASVESLEGEEVRAFVEAAGLIPATPPEVRTERKQAALAWSALARKVNTTLFPYSAYKKAITNAEIKIGQLEELLGESVTRRYTIRNAVGLVDVVLKENALAAGRFAERKAMADDLKKLLDARQALVELYANQFDAGIWRLASAEDRKLLTKYGLLLKKNPLRDPKPNK